jgi:hypothetical protein
MGTSLPRTVIFCDVVEPRSTVNLPNFSLGSPIVREMDRVTDLTDSGGKISIFASCEVFPKIG